MDLTLIFMEAKYLDLKLMEKELQMVSKQHLVRSYGGAQILLL